MGGKKIKTRKDLIQKNRKTMKERSSYLRQRRKTKREHDKQLRIKRRDNTKQDYNSKKAQIDINKTQGQIQVVEAKAENKEHFPRYKKYQGIAKFYTLDMGISSWIRSLESILIDDAPPKLIGHISLESVSVETLKHLETVPLDNLQGYNYLKTRVLQHYRLTRNDFHTRWHDLKRKT